MKAKELLARINEAQFQQMIIDLARIRGWRVAHFRPAQTEKGWRTPMIGDPGFPDLVLARRGVVLFVEVKSERGRLSNPQLEWLETLGVSTNPGPAWQLTPGSMVAFVVRPSDWSWVQDVLV